MSAAERFLRQQRNEQQRAGLVDICLDRGQLRQVQRVTQAHEAVDSRIEVHTAAVDVKPASVAQYAARAGLVKNAAHECERRPPPWL